MNSKTFPKQITSKHFGQADRKKFNRKLFESEIRFAYLAGACGVLFELINEHKVEPFNNVDEFIGDIETRYSVYGTELFKKHLTTHHQKLTVEEIREYMTNER